MRRSIENAEKVYRGLKESKIDFVVHLPESYMKEVIPFIQQDASMKYVQVCREYARFSDNGVHPPKLDAVVQIPRVGILEKSVWGRLKFWM